MANLAVHVLMCARARALRRKWRVVMALEFVVFGCLMFGCVMVGCVRTEQACACDNKNGTATRKFYARDRYLYFAITLLNGRPWWRQLLTTMQISQVAPKTIENLIFTCSTQNNLEFNLHVPPHFPALFHRNSPHAFPPPSSYLTSSCAFTHRCTLCSKEQILRSFGSER